MKENNAYSLSLIEFVYIMHVQMNILLGMKAHLHDVDNLYL